LAAVNIKTAVTIVLTFNNSNAQQQQQQQQQHLTVILGAES
jgi:hypothetical protein